MFGLFSRKFVCVHGQIPKCHWQIPSFWYNLGFVRDKLGFVGFCVRTNPNMPRTNPNYLQNLGVVRENLGFVGFLVRTNPNMSPTNPNFFDNCWDLSVNNWDLSVREF